MPVRILLTPTWHFEPYTCVHVPHTYRNTHIYTCTQSHTYTHTHIQKEQNTFEEKASF